MSKKEVNQNQNEQASEVTISKIKDFPPLDAKLQTVISVEDLFIKFCSVWRQYIEEEQRNNRIIKISEMYSELSMHFEEWKTERARLIGTLRSTSGTLERNTNFVSGFKIATSVTDIVANLGEIPDWILGSGNSWTRLAMSNVSLLGFLALLYKTGYNSKIISDIRKAILNEQKSFDKIIEWYEKTKEFDDVIESFFPFDIDTNTSNTINFSDTDDYKKTVTTLIACNDSPNTSLLDNEKFLKAVRHIATSESGKLWCYKTILQSSPDPQSFKNSRLQKEIPQTLKAHHTRDPEIFLEVLKNFFSSKVNVKITFDVMSIISRSYNILCGSRYDASDVIENFEKCSEEEFKNIEYIVRLFEQIEAEPDSNSQDDISESKKLC